MRLGFLLAFFDRLGTSRITASKLSSRQVMPLDPNYLLRVVF